RLPGGTFLRTEPVAQPIGGRRRTRQVARGSGSPAGSASHAPIRSQTMRSYRFLLALLLPAAIALPAHAGLIFGRHAKVNPAQRVPELIVQVKNDKNESKRESAARELRDYDPTANPDIVPVLVDVVQNDATPSVRAEAAQSLGKLRPVSQIAGWALEEALKDSSIRVRLQARR